MGELGTVDPTSIEYWHDINAALAPLREAAPVARSTIGLYEILRHEHCEKLLRDPSLHTALRSMLTNQGITDGPLHDWWRLIMNNHDGPEHSRIRRLVGRAFTPREADKLRAGMRSCARRILDDLPLGAEVDLFETYCHRFPLEVMCDTLGVPASDHHLVEQWTGTVGIAFSPVIPPETLAQINEAMTAFNDYSADLIERCRANPQDNLLGALVAAEEAGDRLSREELQALIVNLLIGGHDTGKSLLSIGIWLLASHPDELAKLRADPSLIRSAVEEIARYESPISGVPRINLQDLRVGDHEIPAGSYFTMSVPSANRDPRRFHEPDRFDITRADNRHLTFGQGVHHCVGANIARAEMHEALGVLFERVDVTPAIDAPTWVPFAAVRRIEGLPATLTARRGA